jgi:diaminobutyrate acetyltransferase
MIISTTEDREFEVGAPRRGDGLAMWGIAHAAGGLDVNSAYAYVLWVRDFSTTTSVVREAGEVVAYCIAYLRPDAPETLFIWQVAVAPTHRGLHLGRAMFDDLVARTGATAMEATVTPGNDASWRLFRGFAAACNASVTVGDLFVSGDFPAGHDDEQLLRIEPLQ